jgi:hypothetical protein
MVVNGAIDIPNHKQKTGVTLWSHNQKSNGAVPDYILANSICSLPSEIICKTG